VVIAVRRFNSGIAGPLRVPDEASGQPVYPEIT